MNILLIDHDSLIPNLALMKISYYHKSIGDKVYFKSCNNPDKVYISCIFSKNKYSVNGIKTLFNCKVLIGGVGVNNNQLPNKIEKCKPDYSLYNIDYSMGYTSKGCIRNCGFCIVPKLEGKIKNHKSIKEIMHKEHNKLMLFDNNFLASPKFIENSKYILDNNIIVNFNQGLDIRLINNENSKILSDLKIKNRKFNGNQIHFAFDSIKYKDKVIKGINKLKENGIKPYRLMFYILVSYNTEFISDYYRFDLIRNMNCDPFIMIYNNKCKSVIRKFARFVNKRIYKKCEFVDYDRLSFK